MAGAKASTASTTSTESTSASAESTTTRGGVLFTRFGLVNAKGTTFHVCPVEFGDSFLCSIVIVEFDKAEALASARELVRDYGRTDDGTKRGEDLLQFSLINSIGKIPYVQTNSHDRLLSTTQAPSLGLPSK
ncbi:hypothetical protein A3A84_00360 [Candidatus Collierbacteria bacterium RIFCSPLOWO2_01_FULL_50_23]|uniref:Uncharacterized protein n=1 Tax=Candidatus Collierbacteria bacterium RIFCSPHIGHO2_01_FULL_50_25 TaxID=1817722 RepID=A0A1F5EVJ5_9BACT|nr:MAG: hypothetical protein A2703_04030 [Candidatus Collierbacteria bacterium RIFCSPHIGHO2_01_FULL_50_25]OGD74083.1 MAG: hypothetical protein A3A84_00360 [Candidatus Collierbacteria bacterium RIFCSPLOWO2_01_FULL_50_23]